ncbi:hypothetical protein EIN_253160 [Entamoeba invadens IP1]|uniref:Uncharacterized protein n=1 Tax=Entamoeba invadens IP1 TaxID=370355 RepID=A0A0A1UHB9_ENTIV|nr:hypothetical protein EIN_253160 [Entamoeba invadens IP1]ELP95052.1 hypothetical protein EIN_253160 [Entamoeba invadens IP1]|eukprot:XP_004261823.1 hypothetical protein EIN_253160 [Entamoeba invadens IP1]
MSVAEYSLGICVFKSLFGIRMVETVVEKGTKLPTKKRYTFTISQDDQKTIGFEMYKDTVIPNPNMLVGNAEISIPFSPKKGDKVILVIEMKQDGTLDLSATYPNATMVSKQQITLKLTN